MSRKSDNFQLHPPVNKDSNLTTNECGNLELPLIFHAEEDANGKMATKTLQTISAMSSVLHKRQGSRKLGTKTKK